MGRDDDQTRTVAERTDRFAYFMVPIRQTSPDAPDGVLFGVVEQPATGQKQHFASGGELLRIVGDRPAAIPNVGHAPGRGNT